MKESLNHQDWRFQHLFVLCAVIAGGLYIESQVPTRRILFISASSSSSTESLSSISILDHIMTKRSLNSNRLKVIKTYRAKSVYVLDSQNMKHVIPDWTTFLSLGYDVNDIVTVTDEEMKSYAEGEPLDAIKEEDAPPNPYSSCPCFSNAQHLALLKNYTIHKHKYELCFINNSILLDYYQDFKNLFHYSPSSLRMSGIVRNYHELKYSIVSNQFSEVYYHDMLQINHEVANCDLLVEFSDQPDEYKYECPEKCVPLPYTKLPIQWLEEKILDQVANFDFPVTCSMTWKDLLAEGTELSDHRQGKSPPTSTKKDTNFEDEKELNPLELLQPLVEQERKIQNAESSRTSKSRLRIVDDIQTEQQGRRLLRSSQKNLLLSTESSSLLTGSINATLAKLSDSADEKSPHHDRHYLSIRIILKLILQRRLEECHEKDDWKQLSSHRQGGSESVIQHSELNFRNTLDQKRKVFGLIIWVGSRTRYDLLESQIQILKHQNFSDVASISSENVIVGWMASEDQYGCRVGSTVCEEVSSNNAYFHYMPSTRMNVASSGWSCAQRRPLRAVSHALLLYDPQYLLLVDDDTYVSIQILLQESFRRYVRTTLSNHRFVLGQLTEGKKITRKGFYYGGAGYLIGAQSIKDLNAYSIMNPKEPMNSMIDPTQMKELSLYNQVLTLSEKSCPACMKSPNNRISGELGLTAKILVRMVDICVNIMAQEHTCYHSDHAITRCYVHGIYASPMHIPCGGLEIVPGKNGTEDKLYFGMCMGIERCVPEAQLTCHRWKPSAKNVLQPQKLLLAG